MSSKRCSICNGTGHDTVSFNGITYQLASCYPCQGTGYIKAPPVDMSLITCGVQPFEKAKD